MVKRVRRNGLGSLRQCDYNLEKIAIIGRGASHDFSLSGI